MLLLAIPFAVAACSPVTAPPQAAEAPPPTLMPALAPTAVPAVETTRLPIARVAPPTPAASPTPEQRTTRFEKLMRPFLAEAQRRRQAQAAADPRYWSRVDPELNRTRLNF